MPFGTEKTPHSSKDPPSKLQHAHTDRSKAPSRLQKALSEIINALPGYNAMIFALGRGLSELEKGIFKLQKGTSEL